MSSWQHPSGQAINWSQVHSDGHSFAIVKATEDVTYTNPYFASDWSAIKANGMYRGAYHFARPGSSSGAAQAAYFLSFVGNTSEGGDLPPALDLEDSGGLSSGALIAWTQDFVSTVAAQTGRKPMIYSYPNFWKNQMANTTAFTSYPLWIANYTGTSSPTYPLPGGWAQYTFWQYTSSASVPGISGNVDLSRYCCDSASLGGLAYNAAQWAKWYSLGGPVAGQLAVGTNGDGRLEGFAHTSTGAIEHMWQTAPGQGWTSWYVLNGNLNLGDPVVATNRDGRLEAFAIGGTGQLYHAWQTSPSGGWGNWYSLGGTFAGRPTVVANGDGRLEILARGIDGAVWHIWQISPGGGWTGAYSLGGATSTDPSAATNSDGRLEVFVRQADQTVAHSWQMSPGGGWGAWYSLGGTGTGAPTASRNRDGRLEVFAVGADKALYHNWQTSPNGLWFGFSSFGGTFASSPQIGVNADGRLEAFVVDSTNQVEHIWQTSPGGLWVAWATLTGLVASSPAAVGTNSDGRLELLTQASDNAAWHSWQTSRNGGL